MENINTINRRRLTPEDFRLMNIGEGYWNVSISNIPDNFKYKRYILNYITNLDNMIRNGWGLLLYGEYSSGKTALAIIIGKEARRRGFTVFFISALDYIYSRKQLFNEDETIEDRCKSVDLLIIDDIIPDGIDKIEELIRYRNSRKKAVIVTTNIEQKEIKDKLGLSLTEVLMGATLPILIKGINWRQIEKKKIEESLIVK